MLRSIHAILLACALALLGVPAVAGQVPPSRADATLTVVATTTQVRDFVGQVGGDRIRLLPILAPDADPHDYQPTADDARKFAQADVVFANGLGIETWLDPLLSNVRPGVPIVRLGEESGIRLLRGLDDEEDDADPHVWQGPINAQKIVARIRDTLAAADADGATTYQANAAAYTDQLTQLDRWIGDQIQTIPAAQRKLVTNHDAFMYYVMRYGLTFVGSVIPSLSTDAEPSAAETQRLVTSIADQHVKAIYTETSVNPRLEQQIAQLAGVKVYSSLYGDALGQPGTPGETYIGSMRFNTEQIVEGLR